MICPSCNAEVAEGARFCPNCGQSTAQGATSAPADPFATQVISSYNPTQAAATQTAPAQATDASPYGAHASAAQASSPYQATPAYATPEQPYQTAQPAYPTQTAPAYGAADQTYQTPQPSYLQQPTPSYGAQTQGYAPGQIPSEGAMGAATAAAPAAKKSKKIPLIIIAAVVIVLAIGAGVCYGLGVGPFAGFRGGANLDPFGDPLEQLDAAISDIMDSGNFEGDYAMNVAMDLGSLGELAGMDSVDITVDGNYSIQDYDPDDLGKVKIHMRLDMDMDALGQSTSMELDLADGVATATIDGVTETESYSVSEIEDLFFETGEMTFGSSALEGYIESSRIEGDTVIIELDTDFVNELLEQAIGDSLDGEASIDGLELRARVGNGSVNETINMNYTMTSMGYSIDIFFDMDTTMRKL